MSLREILKLDKPGHRVLMMGNYAIARGAIEAGVEVATGYPGTPSTEALEALASVSDELGFYVELSVNEKVAVEVAGGAALAGYKAMSTMKHVGLNVASDIVQTLNLSGIDDGALVLYVADDPGAWVSQNEQDTRVFANFLHLPCLTPHRPGHAKELTIKAFEISKKYSLPVILRTTHRVSHASGVVELGEIPTRTMRPGVFKKNLEKYYLGDVYVQKLHEELHEKLLKLEKEFGDPSLHIVKKSGEIGIIGDGVAFTYAAEAVEILGAESEVSLLGLSAVNPLPTELLLDFLRDMRQVLVVEEVEPYLETQLKAIIGDAGLNVKVLGRKTGHIPWSSELDLELVTKALAKILGKEERMKKVMAVNMDVVEKAKKLTPPRYLSFCPGCPHLATFYELKRAMLFEHVDLRKAPIPLDIGCYGLAPFSAVKIGDISFCMGSGIGVAQGLEIAMEQQIPVVGVIGDSTFYHAGMPALLNAAWNNHPIIMLVADNRTTAMTGHQPHPGVPRRIDGKETIWIKPEDIARATGYEFVEVIDPYDVNKSVETFRKAIRYVRDRRKPAVIVARRECALIAPTKPPYKVDPDKCTGCKVCLTMFGCQALQWDPSTRKVLIRPELCVGCGVCAQICPFKAIVPGGE